MSAWVKRSKIDLIRDYRTAYINFTVDQMPEAYSSSFDIRNGGDVRVFGRYLKQKLGLSMPPLKETKDWVVPPLKETKDWVEANYLFNANGACYVGARERSSTMNFNDLHNDWALIIVKANSL